MSCVPRPVPPSNMSNGTTTSVFHLTICHTVSQPGTVRYIAMLHWSWYRMTHCQGKGTGHGAIWYIVRWNTLVVVPHDTLSGERHCYDTKTSAFHLAMCHTVPPRVYFTWQCAMRYHKQCLSPDNVSCGLVVVPHDTLSGERHCLGYRIAHCQVKYTGCGTAWHIVRWNTLVLVPHSTLPGEIHWLWYRIAHWELTCTACGTVWHIARWYTLVVGTINNVFQLAMCYAVPQLTYFTWQCIMRYHNQCISPVNVPCGTTTSAFHLAMYHTLP
jgi:hypothetical protein